MFLKKHTASLFIDPQNGFTTNCPEQLPVEGGTEIVPSLLKQLDFSTYKTLSKESHNPNSLWIATEDKPQFEPVEGEHENVDIHWNSHCIQGTFGCDLIEGLPKITEYDYVVWKGMESSMHPYGACYHDLSDKLSTGLIEFLMVNQVNTVIVGGLATDYCVYKTCTQLKEVKFDVVLNLEGCRGVAPDTTENAIENMKNIGVHIVEKTDQLENYFY